MANIIYILETGKFCMKLFSKALVIVSWELSIRIVFYILNVKIELQVTWRFFPSVFEAVLEPLLF